MVVLKRIRGRLVFQCHTYLLFGMYIQIYIERDHVIRRIELNQNYINLFSLVIKIRPSLTLLIIYKCLFTDICFSFPDVCFSFSPTCYGHPDEEFVCDACEPGYEGVHCQK